MTVTLWFILAGVLGLAELMTGTFYLLAVSIGGLGGALFAYFELEMTTQLVGVVALDVVGVWLCHQLRQHFARTNLASDQLQSMDVGHQVTVTQWQADGLSTQVHYRGTLWNAKLAIAQPLPLDTPCLCRIIEVKGSVLLLEPVQPSVI
jgi:membrane protein implicated in regulation of membrane protease activity